MQAWQLGGAALCVLMLLYGLASGRMPAGKATPAIKSDDPTSYWVLGGLWAAMAIGLIVWGLLGRS